MRCFIELSLLVHATEDLDKVFKSLRRFFGDLPYIIQPLQGHYGNPIYLITAYSENCEGLLAILCPHIGNSAEAYIRLDKSKLVQGEVAVSRGDDVVRLRIRGADCAGRVKN
ncbi:RNA-binding domain-containing protein [Thermoproteus tenax]|uniref:Exosome subunit n=1 Tax=Thermoproteus tenax (strain ATCC 35583 / DSM 2078 / JCM 9277 / NBRC 100435 / Kra 1) TaxID=768679 RepID=G4RPU4_THETK|nr:RNA-binding domain-containing protein [Thermoproteus tenax]CCC81589.1 exosome subunit [Thermoproteus tenax Kra 1]